MPARHISPILISSGSVSSFFAQGRLSKRTARLRRQKGSTYRVAIYRQRG